MKVEQIEKGQELLKLINITEEALNNLKLYKPDDRNTQKHYDDKLYNLYIGEYRDGSGKNSGNLNRYYGNERLLKVIVEELEKQLKEFKTSFEQL